MSQVREIKQRALQISEQSKKVAGSLQTYKTSFNTLISQINASIGGTATGADADAINYLKGVQKSIDEAVQSLQSAAQETSKWANRL